jgi:hypothetical protein
VSAPPSSSRENPFETETMAELCLRQGHRGESLAIYHRLLARAGDEPTRVRLGARLTAIRADPSVGMTTVPPPTAPSSPALAEPGLRTTVAGDALSIEWRLPSNLPRPRTLELLLVLRTSAGVATETRSLPLERDTGRLDLQIPTLHSARAAIGYHRDNRFIPTLRAQS